jgi:hypothetical protein
VKALHGIPSPGVSTGDVFWADQELPLSFQEFSQPEVCTELAALAGARITKRRAGVRGLESTTIFGFSTFVIPGVFAPRAAHYCARSP